MYENLPEFFTQRLDELLKNLGRKRPWLAETTGIPLSTINGWAARGATPTVPDLVKILRTLNCTLEDFLSPHLDPEGINTKSVMRRTFDELLNGLDDTQLLEFIGAVKLFIVTRQINVKQIDLRDFFVD